MSFSPFKKKELSFDFNQGLKPPPQFFSLTEKPYFCISKSKRKNEFLQKSIGRALLQ